jgi:hypothetical protein
LLEPHVNEVRDVIVTVATHPRRVAGDWRMLVGEADSYAGAVGRLDRDDRIVVKGVACAVAAEGMDAIVRSRTRARAQANWNGAPPRLQIEVPVPPSSVMLPTSVRDCELPSDANTPSGLKIA